MPKEGQCGYVPCMRREALLAAVLTAGAIFELLVQSVHQPLLLVAAIVAPGALSVRSRAPLVSAAVSLGAFAVPVLALARQLPTLGDGPTSLSLTVTWLVAVYTAGTAIGGLATQLSLLLTLGVSLLYALGPGSTGAATVNDALAAALFSAAVPWLAGAAMARHAQARAAERLQEQSQVAAAEERARLARDVHDLVAHSVSVMVVQAEAAEALLPTAPARSTESLRAVQNAGRDALSELRRTVEALRSGSSASQPGLSELPALLERVRAAGVPVTVLSDQEQFGLAPAIDHLAYRVVQEALTNAVRHSDGGGVVIRLHRAEDKVEVSALDGGRPVSRALPGGHGLAGLRELVTAVGGSLSVGATQDGKHLVQAVLPCPS
jgi:signal transduction histidine kinase